jgi:HEAT repeat protein
MSTNYLGVGLLALALVALAPADAAEPRLPRDGWVSWRVPAVEGAPAWCCFSSWNDRDPSRMACKLDGGADGFGIHGGEKTTDTVTVYARTAGGKIDRLQALAASCPVETKTSIQPLEDVSAEESARWLMSQVKQEATDALTDRPIGESALSALALHRGNLARDALAGFARDAGTETRKWSVFWLALLRGSEGADITSSVMFGDPDTEVREHAAFALSQSKAPRATPDLIRLGNTDKVGDVRAKAWFWLAHTGATEAEQAIGVALRKDQDDAVREQAIFALSRLPGERATNALIKLAEDQSLSHEQRKRAVFWLSQSESDAAQAYLEKVLARNTPR